MEMQTRRGRGGQEENITMKICLSRVFNLPKCMNLSLEEQELVDFILTLVYFFCEDQNVELEAGWRKKSVHQVRRKNKKKITKIKAYISIKVNHNVCCHKV